ncbi:NUMOD3 domain-containing DNA-binding protein [Candidatus Pelagibacter bacterium nBUS_33]|uniref:NUMOD3 domain-containing DNA-binding protein n=1 Tax=Candidatus Pelagibacter bacterium nBUS_33 TaxID=3374193 RepID=UPI003EB78BF7
MKTDEFKKVKPYTYYILRKSDGVKYHGVRYRNKVSPINDFGIKYFGSSKSNICSQFKKNPKNFTFRLGWTFDTEKEAIQYETKVNKKIYKKEDWANKAAFPAIHMDDEVIANISKALKGTRIGKKNNFYGKEHSKKTKKLISLTKKNMSLKLTDYQKKRITESNKTRTYSKATLKKLSLINKGKKWSKAVRKRMSLGSIGKILSNETKKKISIKVKGKNNPMFGKTHSEVARKKMSLSKKGRIPWNKGKSYKTGRIPWNKGKSYTITKKPQIDE